MNANTFGKWLLGISALFYLLVHVWGVSPWWTLIPCFTAGVAVAMMISKLSSKKALVLWGVWAAYTFVVALCFR